MNIRPHITVGDLAAVLATLPQQDILVTNDQRQLSVLDNDLNYVAWIDFKEAAVCICEQADHSRFENAKGYSRLRRSLNEPV